MMTVVANLKLFFWHKLKVFIFNKKKKIAITTQQSMVRCNDNFLNSR